MLYDGETYGFPVVFETFPIFPDKVVGWTLFHALHFPQFCETDNAVTLEVTSGLLLREHFTWSVFYFCHPFFPKPSFLALFWR